MSKLNPVVSSFQRAAVARSYNGNPQVFKQLHQQLFEMAVGFIYGRDTYYEAADVRLQRLRVLIDTIVKQDGADGARFIADVALFTREVGGLRSAPVILLAELANSIRKHSVNPQLFSLREHVRETVQRVDELTDLYAYSMSVFGGKGDVPLAIKKGVADAFSKFDAYQFGKYRNRDGGLKLKDLMRIVHPKPADEEHARIFNGIINDSLELPATHEIAFTKNGQLPKSERREDASIWLEFLKRGRGETGSLGLLALIRNLKRMAEANLGPTGWDLVRDRLAAASDREVGKLLAFNLINSYNYAKQAGVPSHVLGALSHLTERSFGFLPIQGERVLVILDTSGSMNDQIAVPPGQKPLDLNKPSMAAVLFAVAILKQTALHGKRSALIRFSSNAEVLNLNPADSVNTLYTEVMSQVRGGGTNLEGALELKQQLGWEPDTVFLLSDMQVDVFMGKRKVMMWGQSAVTKPVDVNKYFTAGTKKRVAFNFNSYDSTPVGEDYGWFQMAGWSPNVFKFLSLSDGAGSMAQAIYALGPGAWRSKPELVEEEV